MASPVSRVIAPFRSQICTSKVVPLNSKYINARNAIEGGDKLLICNYSEYVKPTPTISTVLPFEVDRIEIRDINT